MTATKIMPFQQPTPREPVLAYGHVLDDDELTVHLADGRRLARRAKSCLVAPMPGDRVLCSVDAGTVYVLAVLESEAEDAPTRVAIEGNLELEAGALAMRAKSGSVVIDELKLFGRWIDASFADRATLLAERVETRASRVLQRAKQAYRFVTDLEQARVGHFDLRAENLAAVRGENTIISARVLAKLDGEQVKIG